MHPTLSLPIADAPAPVVVATTETPLVRRLLIGTALVFLAFFLGLPLAAVFYQAFEAGLGTYVAAIFEPETLSAVKLTLLAAVAAVSLNAVFGIAAAWAVTKFEFTGKSLLITLIDLPFTISPVVSGLMFVLLFGTNGFFGPILDTLGLKIVFAAPGVIMATIFVTFPFIARELIPLMQEQGTEEEQAAVVLGARPWQLFFRVTLPNIRWGLLYGIILCNARAMGEFGAVSVVSGHIRGLTNTLPLHVEVLYNEYQFAAAFAAASLLTLLALATLVLKTLVERRTMRRQAALPQADKEEVLA